MMLPSGNDAAYTLAEFVGRKLYMRTEEYRRRLQDEIR
jgi:D-alanyl-D-alanine carboxypeptidase